MNIAKSSNSKSNYYHKDMVNPTEVNSLFGNLDGFSFGIGTDHDKNNYFSQKDRIFILNKVINEFLNIDWLKKEKYVTE